MNKIHHISLGGFAFSIDDNAYQELRSYIHRIKTYLGVSEDTNEIIADVEYRMVELLRERLKNREVVNSEDVAYFISILGKPEDFVDEEDREEKETSTNNNKNTNTTAKKKFFRDSDNKVLGGVCSGFAHYTSLDVVWVRIIYIVVMFCGVPLIESMSGLLFLLYFLLWIVVPKAITTSEKLQMRGEPVNVDSIKNFLGNKYEEVKSDISNFQNRTRTPEKSSSLISDLFRFAVKAIGIFIIVILLIVAFSLLLGLFAIPFGGGSFNMNTQEYDLGNVISLFFENGWEQWLGYISLGLVLIIPIIGLIFLLLRIVSSRYRAPKIIITSMIILWVLGFIGVSVSAGLTTRHFKRKAQEVKTMYIPNNTNTLIIKTNESKDFAESGLTYADFGSMKVKPSKNNTSYLEIKFKARGKNKSDAKRNIQGLEYNYSIINDVIYLDEYLQLSEGSKWRMQEVEHTLYLAEGKKVSFEAVDVKLSNGDIYWHDEDAEEIYQFNNGNWECINNERQSQSQIKIKTTVTKNVNGKKVTTEKESIINK